MSLLKLEPRLGIDVTNYKIKYSERNKKISIFQFCNILAVLANIMIV